MLNFDVSDAAAIVSVLAPLLPTRARTLAYRLRVAGTDVAYCWHVALTCLALTRRVTCYQGNELCIMPCRCGSLCA
eukprot:2426045-Rhodomonas_salina.1